MTSQRPDDESPRAPVAGRALAERMAVLMHAIPCGVVIVDGHGVVDVTNDEFLQQFALQDQDTAGVADRILQARLADLAQDPGAFLAGVRALDGCTEITTDQILFGDGRVIERDYIPVVAGSIEDGWIWTYWDFTERQRSAEQEKRQLRAEVAAREIGLLGQRDRVRAAEESGRELAQDNESLRRRDALRAQLLATASHELRTPLTSIMSFAEVMAEPGVTEEERAEFVAIIQRNAHRLLTLVDDLLLLTRLGSEATPLRTQRIGIGGVVDGVVTSARARTRAGGPRILRAGQGDPRVEADPERLAQVFDNLVTNALKYGSPDGEIRVTVDDLPGRVGVTVSDDGPGIPPDELESVFERFFRSTSARASAVPGTGLGLALVQSIVERHGGTVSIESTVGVGTRVRVELPTAEEEPDDG